MAGLRHIIVTLLLGGLFVFALFQFGIEWSDVTGANISLVNYAGVNSTVNKIEANLSKSQNTAELGLLSLAKSIPIIGEAINLESVTRYWTTIKTIPTAVYASTAGLVYESIFGGDGDSPFNIIFLVLGAILAITIALYAWKTVRTGDPD